MANKSLLHLDTDLGGDIDDLCALALAGRAEVPVAAGADAAQGHYRSWPGLPDEATYWPEPIPPAPAPLDEALSLLQRSVEQGATIAAIGPFTNLALLEKRSPGILRRARLVLMGGYVFPPRAGFPAWGSDMDYNVQVDVESTHYVMQHSDPVLVPLSVTVETWLRRAYLSALSRSGPLARLIARQAEAFARDEAIEARYGRTCPGLPDDTLNFQHDPLACAIALGWQNGVEIDEIPLKSEIEDGWLRQRVDPGGTPTRVVTRVDGGKFSEFWLSSVAGG